MRERVAIVAPGIALVLALSGLPGCGGWNSNDTNAAPGGRSAVPADRNARAGDGSPGGDSATRIVYPGQNWTPEQSQQFYFTSQGSQILPYDWFLVLERAEDETLLRDDRNMLKFGYLLQKADGWN